MKKIYPISASQFIAWATHPTVIHKVRGIIEHYCHHVAVRKYQLTTVVRPEAEQNWFADENMPDAVRLASLVMSETPISCVHSEFRMHGRIDQLYKLGTFFLVDTKSHEEPTFADQLQLSFYSFILHSRGYRMVDVAYIRSTYGNTTTYKVVEIIPLPAMEEIINEVE